METPPMTHGVRTFSVVQKGYIVQLKTIIVGNNQQWSLRLILSASITRSYVYTYVLFYVFTQTLKVQSFPL